ncbi:hypothetical protein [Ferruginibacter albus]|uniref:hypothetical protein n=1 Tax=Ferruginibacter albus TaxID=2875540 RepID=UPI001CC4A249|nr:hypothetical protein [Ferruginibacter albus]UAY52994.1 hypothetical protein K9M53_04775 [Ferruginibacter albus]
MIIGTGKSKRLTEKIEGVECPACKAKDSLVAEGYQDFFNFGLPVFPTTKRVEIKCSQCKKFLNNNELPYPHNSLVMDIKQRIKPAVWMFIIPIIAAIGIPISLIKQSMTAKENISKINKAHKGDVYTFEVGDRLYQKMQIEKVKGDSIWFLASLNSPANKQNLGNNDVFEGYELTYTTTQLLKRNDDHEIIDIVQ